MAKEIDRTVDLEMDERGRVIIPKKIRDRFGIDPSDGDSTWLTVTIEEADPPGGDS